MFNILRFNINGISDVNTMTIDYYNSDFSTYSGSANTVDRWYPFDANVKPQISQLWGGWESLKNGEDKFSYIDNLQLVKTTFPELIEASGMFEGCQGLKSATIVAPILEVMYHMFLDCPSLETVDMYIPNIVTASRRVSGVWAGPFADCPSLKSFRGDLVKLDTGCNMFDNCSSLEEFDSSIPSLQQGEDMFNSCILNSESVMNIVSSIPEVQSGDITIGIGIANNDDMKQAFAVECGCTSWDDLNQEFTDKGWTVQWQYNGPATMGLRGGNVSHKVYVKVEEVENSKYCKYTSEDGSKFFNVSWYHDSNGDNEGYTQYDNLEEALSQLGIIKIK